MLHLNLTAEDVTDLRNVGTINAMTEEGVEVIGVPEDFTPLVWAALDSDNPVAINMEVIGQHNVVEVEVVAPKPRLTDNAGVSLYLNQWCVARLKDSRESGEVDTDLSDAVIEREANRLEMQVFQLASTFVDNEFNEKE